MSWDGKERRSDDHASRLAQLEAYSKIQNVTIGELKTDLRTIRTCVEDIRRDIHGARIGGRVGLGIAVALGGMIAWMVSLTMKGAE